MDNMKYRAFISYKHAASTAFAVNLELAIKAYAKPIWRPPMRIFRDEKFLRPGANLPALIRNALEESEFLIYLASPEASQSQWVRDELEHWCKDEDRLKRLIVILTDGAIVANPKTKHLDWEHTDALPGSLAGRLVFVPLYVDLSWARDPDLQTLLNPDYKKAINLIVATLRDIDPIELSGVEILQHRKNLRIRNTFIASIVVLALGMAGAAVFAWIQMRHAQWRAIYSEALRLAELSPNLAARELRELSPRADVDAPPLAWHLINRTPVWSAAVFRGHRDLIWSMTFSPVDGRLATGGGDGTVRLWTLDGASPPTVLGGHRGLVLDIEFSRDGRHIATVAEVDAVRVWDARSGKLLREFPLNEQVNRLAYNPAGSGLMLASFRHLKILQDDGTATTLAGVPRLIDAAWSPDGMVIATASSKAGVGAQIHAVTGGAPHTLEGTAAVGTYAVEFSPDGTTIAVICLDGTLRLFPRAGARSPRILQPASAKASRAPVLQTAERLVGFSAGGKVVAGAFGSELHVWPAATTGEAQVLKHDAVIEDFDLGDGGRRIVSLDARGETRLWTLNDEGKYQWDPVRGHANVNRVALTPDGRQIVTGAGDGTIRVWDHERPMRPVVTLDDHAAAVTDIDFSPDSKSVVTAAEDGAVRIWHTEDGRPLATLRPQKGGALRSAAFSPDGRLVVAGGTSGAYVWLAEGNGQPEQLHKGPVIEAGFDPRGEWIIIVAGSRNAARVLLYPVDKVERPRIFQGLAHISPFGPLDPTGRRVVTFSPGEQLAFVYRLEGGRPIALEGHTQLVLDAAFGPDGRRVVTASSDWSIRLWDPQDGRETDRFEGAGTEVELARYSPDGSTIVTYSSEHMIRLWNLKGRIIRKIQAGGAPEHVEFSRDGSKLLIVENGFRGHRLVRVVNTQADGNPMLLTGHTKRLRHATFSPDGRRIATASEDGTAKIYAIDWPSLRKTLMKRSPVVFTSEE